MSAAPNPQAYALFIDSLCEGPTPVEFDGEGKPVLYPTLAAAQRVIAEDVRDRINEYLAGEREFDDAMNPEEYPCLVEVLPDGRVRPFTEGFPA